MWLLVVQNGLCVYCVPRVEHPVSIFEYTSCEMSTPESRTADGGPWGAKLPQESTGVWVFHKREQAMSFVVCSPPVLSIHASYPRHPALDPVSYSNTLTPTYSGLETAVKR